MRQTYHVQVFHMTQGRVLDVDNHLRILAEFNMISTFVKSLFINKGPCCGKTAECVFVQCTFIIII